MKLLKHKVQGYYININHQGNVKKIYFGKHTTKEEATLLASEYRVQQQRAKLGLVCSDCGKNIESKNQEEDIAIYELFNKFLDWLKQHHKNEGVKEEQHDTIKSFFYSEPLKNWFDLNNLKNVKDINQGHAQELITSLLGDGFKNGEGYSNKTAKERFSWVKRAIDWGSFVQGLFENPWEKSGGYKTYTLPKIKGHQKIYLKFSDEMLGYIFKDPRFGEFYQWLYYTGFRSTELASVKYSDIDYARRTLFLSVSKSNYSRNFGLHQILANKVKLAQDMGKDGAIFPQLYHEDQKKRKNRVGTARNHLQFRVLPRIGIKHKDVNGNVYTLHGLRGTSAQAIQGLGASQDQIAIHLGHKSDGTVSKYVDPDPQVANQLLDKLPTIESGV